MEPEPIGEVYTADCRGVSVVCLRYDKAAIERDSSLRLELQSNGTTLPREKGSDRSDLIQDWFLFEEWDSEFEQKHNEAVPIDHKFYKGRFPSPPPETPQPPAIRSFYF